MPRPSVMERARMCLEKMEPAIAGQDGHGRTFAAACAAAVGFGLDEGQVLDLLYGYNLRCSPAWSEKELRHKARQAVREAERAPEKVGYLRDAGNSDGFSGPENSFSTAENSFSGVKNSSGRVFNGKSKGENQFSKAENSFSKHENPPASAENSGQKPCQDPKKAKIGRVGQKRPVVFPRKGRIEGDSRTPRTGFRGTLSHVRRACARALRESEENTSEASGAPQMPVDGSQPVAASVRREGACCEWSPPPYFRRVRRLVWQGAERVEEVAFEEAADGDHVQIKGKYYLSFQALEKRMRNESMERKGKQ